MQHRKNIKKTLHPRNKNREHYDLAALVLAVPALKKYVQRNTHGTKSIDFSDAKAVKLLNQSLLNHYYSITYWEFPDTNLCPPIPGRADYVHYMADCLAESNGGILPKGSKIKCIDIGVGASCIYPIIGVKEYDWNFIGTDIDVASIASS